MDHFHQDVLFGHHLDHRAEAVSDFLGHFHALQQRLVQVIVQDVDDHGQEIGNGIDQRHGKTVAHTQSAAHGQTEEEQVLQGDSRQPVNGHHGAGTQQGQGDQGENGVGHQAEQQARDDVGHVPALPAQGHGMQGVAMAGIEQITKEDLAVDVAVDQVDDDHKRSVTHQRVGPVIIGAFGGQDKQGQDQHDAVQGPGRREAGDILLQRGGITERCS